jgi:hypothetical protein
VDVIMMALALGFDGLGTPLAIGKPIISSYS